MLGNVRDSPYLSSFSPQKFTEKMAAVMQNYHPEDDARILWLTQRLESIRKIEEAILKELRPLIYKIEKPR